MTMSTAEYVCENGVWMRLHAAERTSHLPQCVSETDVGRLTELYIFSYYHSVIHCKQ